MSIRNYKLSKTVAFCTILLLTFAGVNPANASGVSTQLKEKLESNFESEQWGLDAAKVEQAWTYATGKGVRIAVIDTGVDGTHPDLAGKLETGYFIDGQLRVTEVAGEAFKDSDAHGTHIAGIIAANRNSFGITGVAYDSTIVPINVYEPLSSENGETANLALTKAVEIATSLDVDVISISIGGGDIEAYDPKEEYAEEVAKIIASREKLCKTITSAFNQGSVVVIAAGNDGSVGNPVSNPANCENAVSVSALDTALEVAYWSSYDETVDISAPGQSILSTIPVAFREWFPYTEFSGTSMATPLVSGVFALAKQRYPNYSAEQLVSLVKSSATDLGPLGVDPQYGVGIVNALKVVSGEYGIDSPNGYPYLSFSVRNSIGNDPRSFAINWAPPKTRQNPSHYVAEVYDRYGNERSEYRYSGLSVRGSLKAPVSWNNGFWILMTAVYPDGSVIKGEPWFDKGAPEDLKNVKFSEPVFVHSSEGGSGLSMTVSWDPIDNLATDAVVISGFGPAFNWYWLVEVKPDPLTGKIPNSYKIWLNEYRIYQGMRLSDADINFEVSTATNPDSFFPQYGAITKYQIKGKNGMTVVNVLEESNYIETTGGINASYASACGNTCIGKTALLTYTLTTKVKGKPVRSVVTKKVELTEPLDDAYGIAAEFNHILTFKTFPEKVQLRITLLDSKGKETKVTSRAFTIVNSDWKGPR